MKVLITASRDWPDPGKVWQELDDQLRIAVEKNVTLTVIHGDCPTGGDRHAREWVRNRVLWAELYSLGDPLQVQELRYPAQWVRYGRRAGFVRNQVMVDLMPDVCLAFVMPCRKCPRRDVHSSHGAADTIMRCESWGIPVREFRLMEGA